MVGVCPAVRLWMPALDPEAGGTWRMHQLNNSPLAVEGLRSNVPRMTNARLRMWGLRFNETTDNNHGGDNCERYHPTSLTERICTNSNIYPSLWNEPGMTSKYFFTSPFDCCDMFYDGMCDEIVDVCSTANDDGGGGGDYTCAGRNKRPCRNEGRCTSAFDIDVCVRSGGGSVYDDDPGCGVWYASDASSSAW